MSQADVPIDPDATRIRTAAGHCFRHRSDEVLVRAEIAILANLASYSADRVILRVRFPCQHAAYPVQRVLNGIFWVLRSGAPWRDLPEAFGPYTPATTDLSGGGGLVSGAASSTHLPVPMMPLSR